ncbi:MAG: Asp-tRNA(Asn)/Glu-tRNA(Gln) amidotransferase subunit GatC [Acidimicrobiales bacterium]
MALISVDEVRHVAKLARLELSDDELEVLQGELSALLDHVETITSLDTSGVPPTAHPLPLSNVLRSDEPSPGLTPAQALAGAPAVEDGRFSVPSILGEAP